MGSEQSRPNNNKQKKSSIIWNSQNLVKKSITSLNNSKLRENSNDNNSNPNPNQDHNTENDNINSQSITENKSFRQLFSDLELDVLYSTWPLLSKNPIRTGCLIFKNAFEIHPKLSTFFPFGHLSPDVLVDSPDCKRHSAKVMRVIHMAVKALEGDSKSLYEELALLGAKHAAIRNMKIEYFKIIKEAILMTWGRLIYEEFTDDVKNAWGHVLDEIVGIMGVGCLIFEEEEERILQEEEEEGDHIQEFITSSDDYQQNYKMHNKKSRLSVATVPKEELDQIYPNCK
uniref:GLOBIN domain-containing protein n=1 Tax=Schistosoma mansoni TaxID=6183 RepID=A0A3Q0KU64_SCHMA